MSNKSLEKSIADTCVFLYTELSSIEPSEDLNLSDILKLSPQEGVEFIKQTSKDLLAVKRNFLMLDQYRDFNYEQQYQKALQKLESEVRNHIKIEQQLKIQLESSQNKLEETKKKFMKEYTQLQTQLAECQNKLSKPKENFEGNRAAEVRPASALRGLKINPACFKGPKRIRQAIRRPLSSQSNSTPNKP